MNDHAPDDPTTDRVPVAAGESDRVPAVASARHYLRDALPSIYREQPFTMRFLEALERVLDARVAIIDCLWAYLAPELAPERMVDAMADWLGLELDDVQAGGACREPPVDDREIARLRRGRLVNARKIACRRATAAGLQDALSAAFPGLGLRVHDKGKAVVSSAADWAPLAANPGFTVTCPRPLTPACEAAVQAAIARQLPLHVKHTLEQESEPEESAR